MTRFIVKSIFTFFTIKAYRIKKQLSDESLRSKEDINSPSEFTYMIIYQYSSDRERFIINAKHSLLGFGETHMVFNLVNEWSSVWYAVSSGTRVWLVEIIFVLRCSF